MLKATVDGLKNLRRPEDVARIRGLSISQVLPVPKVQVSDTPAGTSVLPAPVSDTTESPEAPESAEATE